MNVAFRRHAIDLLAITVHSISGNNNHNVKVKANRVGMTLCLVHQVDVSIHLDGVYTQHPLFLSVHVTIVQAHPTYELDAEWVPHMLKLELAKERNLLKDIQIQTPPQSDPAFFLNTQLPNYNRSVQ